MRNWVGKKVAHTTSVAPMSSFTAAMISSVRSNGDRRRPRPTDGPTRYMYEYGTSMGFL